MIGGSRSRLGTFGVLVAALVAVPASVHAASLALTTQRLTAVATCALAAYPSTALVDADSYVQQLVPTMTAGNGASMTVRTGNGTNDRSYVRFDLTKCLVAVPANAIVRTATLQLYVTAMSASCRVLDVFAAPSSWAEGTVNWNNQPVGTAINNPPASQRTSSTQVGSPMACANRTNNRYVSWDVTADVGRFVNGSATNYGWLIRDDTEGSATSYGETFTASNGGSLVISYTLV